MANRQRRAALWERTYNEYIATIRDNRYRAAYQEAYQQLYTEALKECGDDSNPAMYTEEDANGFAEAEAERIAVDSETDLRAREAADRAVEAAEGAKDEITAWKL
ncbi:MAG TPA: hypothetical protein VFN11_02370 [Ktedonobacterales bacterium]|nr:hypothetical protein [Ktedonobacterales bacterium]